MDMPRKDPDIIILENLILKRFQDKDGQQLLAVVSDETELSKQRGETFRNKEKLKAAKFTWNGYINSWVLPQAYLQQAQETLARINKSPVEQFIKKVEELPELVLGADNLSKKEELSQKIEGYIDQLAGAVDEAAASKAIQAFLTFNAKFRSYSFHNAMLIFIQRPDATRVAGFKQWEEKFFRRVKKEAFGHKAIWIFAPISVKSPYQPTTPKPGAGATPGATGQEPEGDEEDLTAPKERRFTRFKAVQVYDVSDTEPIDERGNVPPEPEWHGSNEPNQRADELYAAAEELFGDIGGKLTIDPSKGGEQGWAKGDHINITSTIGGVNKAATVIHEIAHSLLHFKKSSPFFVGDIEGEEGRPDPTATPSDQNKKRPILTRDLAELQAESVSFVVIKYFDLPVQHQATYLALWKANKDTIRQNLTVIKKCADFIIGELDKILAAKPKAAASSAPAALFECVEGHRFRLRQ